MFTDETKVNLVRSDEKSYVRRYKSEKLNPQFIKGQMQAGRGSILMWVLFHMMVLAPLCEYATHLTLDKYIQILKDAVKPFVEKIIPPNLSFTKINLVHTAN